MKVNATDMKNSFGKYLDKCKEEDVLITKNGKTVARLIRFEDPSTSGCLMLKEGLSAYAFTGKKVTYDEFIKITDDHEERYEYIDGELYLLSSPGIRHQVIHANLYAILADWFRGKACRVFSAPFDVTLTNENKKGQNVVQPDLLVSCDYMTKRDPRDRYTGIPDLVVEIISPQTRSMDQVKKLNVYLDGGIREYWTVDPRDVKVTVYSFSNHQLEDMIMHKHPDLIQSFCFKGLSVSTDDIFRG